MNALASRDAARPSRRLPPGNCSLITALLLIAPPVSAAPPGEYGDAPDNLSAHYPPPDANVIGRFPTRFNTSNSRYGLPGGHTLDAQFEYLGGGSSIEVDATDPNDPDGAPNLVDNDADTGLPVETGFFGAICKPTPFQPPFDSGIVVELSFIVTVFWGAPPGTRYLNVLLDMNGDGEWRNEWVAIDYPVLLNPGGAAIVTIPAFAYELSPHPMWLRAAFTRAPISGTFADDGTGWDGSGAFAHGEIEDHLVQPVALIYAQDAARAADSASQTAVRTAQQASFQVAWAFDIDGFNLDLQLDAAITAATVAGAAAGAAAAAAAAAEQSAVDSDNAQQAAAASALAVSAACVSCNCATLCASSIAFAEAGANAGSHAWASAEASATAAAQAAAFALAVAAAAADAVLALNLQIDAIAVANADAGAAAVASSAAAASAQAAASAAADAQVFALLAACSGNAALAYDASASASAQASATAVALATASANTAAVANAFAGA